MIRPPPISTLFPYTTLSRSGSAPRSSVAAALAAARRCSWWAARRPPTRPRRTTSSTGCSPAPACGSGSTRPRRWSSPARDEGQGSGPALDPQRTRAGGGGGRRREGRVTEASARQRDGADADLVGSRRAREIHDREVIVRRRQGQGQIGVRGGRGVGGEYLNHRVTGLRDLEHIQVEILEGVRVHAWKRVEPHLRARRDAAVDIVEPDPVDVVRILDRQRVAKRRRERAPEVGGIARVVVLVRVRGQLALVPRDDAEAIASGCPVQRDAVQGTGPEILESDDGRVRDPFGGRESPAVTRVGARAEGPSVVAEIGRASCRERV